MKIKHKIIAFISFVVAIWFGMFITDYNRTTNLKQPLFCPVIKDGVTADDGGSGTFMGPGYTVTLKKQLDEYSAGGVKICYAEIKIFGKTIAAAIE